MAAFDEFDANDQMYLHYVDRAAQQMSELESPSAAVAFCRDNGQFYIVGNKALCQLTDEQARAMCNSLYAFITQSMERGSNEAGQQPGS